MQKMVDWIFSLAWFDNIVTRKQGDEDRVCLKLSFHEKNGRGKIVQAVFILRNDNIVSACISQSVEDMVLS